MAMIEPPNYTQTPNVFYDFWMPRLSSSAFVVLFCLCRKIFGWHKTTDTISKAQISKCTGLSKPTVIRAIAELKKHNLLIEHHFCDQKTHKPSEFSLNIQKPRDEVYSENSEAEVVKNFNQLSGKESLPVTSKESLPTKERLNKRKDNDLSLSLTVEAACAREEEVKKKLEKNALTVPQEVERVKPDGTMQKWSKGKIIHSAVRKREDWDILEIEEAWEAFVKATAPCSDAYEYIKRSIKNLREERGFKSVNYNVKKPKVFNSANNMPPTKYAKAHIGCGWPPEILKKLQEEDEKRRLFFEKKYGKEQGR